MNEHRELVRLLERVQNIDTNSLKMHFAHHLEYTLGKYSHDFGSADIYQALAYVVRDALIDRWNETQDTIRAGRAKRVYYLSMEFLLGNLLQLNLVNVGMRSIAETALAQLGFDLQKVSEYEPDAGLGNGGLGRLAACFLDSVTALNIPCQGACLRYEFGIFHQQIVDGFQKEAPDTWLSRGNPWEVPRNDIRYPIGFGGQVVQANGDGRAWLPSETLVAQAYDILVPGFNTRMVNHLRLWRAQSNTEFNFDYFNHGDYVRAVEDKQSSEKISKVLYPNENILQGKELRLKQEFFLVSATLKDAIRVFREEEGENWSRLPERAVFQLNDTHPALAVAELQRLLMDNHGLVRDDAWDITRRCMAYTNHTMMPEALETWDLNMLGRLLPRHLEVIYDINHYFLEDLREKGASEAELSRLSIIDEREPRRARMANLAIIGSKAVNGVAALHSELIKKTLFRDFVRYFPDRFQNKTNGIAHRKWLLTANPELSEVITARIGRDWMLDLSRMRPLEEYAADPEFQEQWNHVRLLNKRKLGDIMQFECGVTPDPGSIFDVHVKRIHEYKRQLLNILRVIRDYQMLCDDPDQEYTPRTVIFAGKAAPGYLRAKLIIKLIHSVGDLVNHEPLLRDRLKVAFLPDFRVSLAERIYPAADLSEQISTAGTEASGTGNMKFMLNGALTVGTLDGANVEILEAVGRENIYIFGKTVDEIDALRDSYEPQRIYREDPVTHRVLRSLRENHFSRKHPGLFEELFFHLSSIDTYRLLADFPQYLEVQDGIGRDFQNRSDWTRRSIINTARSGRFSSDRTIQEYADDIWKVQPLMQNREPRISALDRASPS